MRTDPKFWSDGFEIVDDPEFTVLFEDDLDEPCVEDAYLEYRQRKQTSWQRLEDWLGERQLRADLGDWDYSDDYLAAH